MSHQTVAHKIEKITVRMPDGRPIILDIRDCTVLFRGAVIQPAALRIIIDNSNVLDRLENKSGHEISEMIGDKKLVEG